VIRERLVVGGVEVISIVICSVDAARFAAISARYRQLLAAEPHEIIGVHDAKSLCEGYNRGFQQSTGEIVVFSHDDIEILTEAFAERVKRHLARYDVLGVAGTDRLVGPGWVGAGPPHLFGQVAHRNRLTGECSVYIYGVPSRVVSGIRAMDGVFLAFRRSVVERLRWDDETFTGFHHYDLDMTFRAHLAGYRLAVVNDIPIVHESRGDYGPEWEVHAERFIQKHLHNLEVMAPRKFQLSFVATPTRDDLLEVMTPRYWTD